MRRPRDVEFRSFPQALSRCSRGHPKTLLVAWTALLIGCRGGDDHRESTTPGAPLGPILGAVIACPPGMLGIDGFRGTLGAADPTELQKFGRNTIPLGNYAIGAFCIEVFPFPGQEGASWPEDGLSWEDAATADAWLQGFGRRLCSTLELLLAAAGPDNFPFPWVERPPQPPCPMDDRNPGLIGESETCVSELGVRDFQVRSAWTRLDPALDAILALREAPALPRWYTPDQRPVTAWDREWVVWGGTSRPDTFSAPDNFGIHTHIKGDVAFQDDGLRVCADPWWSPSVLDDLYADAQVHVAGTGSYAAVLSGLNAQGSGP